jgi:hypothetical protein
MIDISAVRRGGTKFVLETSFGRPSMMVIIV